MPYLQWATTTLFPGQCWLLSQLVLTPILVVGGSAVTSGSTPCDRPSHDRLSSLSPETKGPLLCYSPPTHLALTSKAFEDNVVLNYKYK
jgi:hypothetical protein